MLKSLFGNKRDTMILFECEQCGYSESARAETDEKVRIPPVTQTARGKLDKDSWTLLRDMGDISCENCGRLVGIEHMSRDACPHKWVFHSPTKRHCKFCGTEEVARFAKDERDT